MYKNDFIDEISNEVDPQLRVYKKFMKVYNERGLQWPRVLPKIQNITEASEYKFNHLVPSVMFRVAVWGSNQVQAIMRITGPGRDAMTEMFPLFPKENVEITILQNGRILTKAQGPLDTIAIKALALKEAKADFSELMTVRVKNLGLHSDRSNYNKAFFLNSTEEMVAWLKSPEFHLELLKKVDDFGVLRERLKLYGIIADESKPLEDYLKQVPGGDFNIHGVMALQNFLVNMANESLSNEELIKKGIDPKKLADLRQMEEWLESNK